MPRRIQPGWRYNIAQFVLTLLFNRPWHHISPWMMVGTGAAAALTSPDGQRVLLQQRAGAVEGAGKWGTFGGYLTIEDAETFAEGLAREFWEETGLRVDPSNFNTAPDNVVIVHNQVKNELWQHSTVGVWFFRMVPDNFDTLLNTSTEVSAYRWVTLDELDAMWSRGEISGAPDDHYNSLRAALLAAAKTRPMALNLS